MPYEDTYNSGSDDRIACPYCGEINDDLWETAPIRCPGMEWDTEVECVGCGREFGLSRTVTVHYRGFALGEEGS